MWDSLDLRDVATLLRGRWRRVALAVFFFASMGLYLGWAVVPPRFTASAMLYVSGAVEGGTDPGTLSQSHKLAETCVLLLQSDRVLETALAQAKLDGYNPETLRRHLKLHPLRGTGMVRVSVSGPDSEISALVANLIAQQADAEFARVVRGGSAVVAETAKPPETADLPGPLLYCLFGGLAGGAGSILWLIARVRMGERVCELAEWEALCGTRLLGEAVDRQIRETAGRLLLALEQAPHRTVAILPLDGDVPAVWELFACALARLGNRVLAVVGDWKTPGISSLLEGNCEPSDAIQQGLEFDLLSMDDMGGGLPETFPSLLNWLQTRYDIILFDCPPPMKSAAGLLFGQHCAGVLLTVRSGASKRDLEKTSVQMQFAGVRLLGVAVAQPPKPSQ